MDFNATIDLIIKDLDEAGKIIDDLKKYPGVPSLQVELAKAKCRSAGEVIALLKNSEEETEVIISAPDEPDNVIQLIEKDEISPGTFEIENEELKDEVSTELKIEVQDEITEEGTEEVAEEVNEELKEELKEEAVFPSDRSGDSSIMADKFSHLSPRFNEQLGKQKDEDDVPEGLLQKPISRLEDAIGINDRFLFIREIFDNNKDSYKVAISQLDNADNLKDAIDIIRSYTGGKLENKSVKQLIGLVKRKLPSDE